MIKITTDKNEYLRLPFTSINLEEDGSLSITCCGVGVGARYRDKSNTCLCTLTDEIVQPREDMKV